MTGAEKGLVDHLYRDRPLQLQRNAGLKLASRVGETAEEFAARCRAAAEDAADAAQAALTRKYEARLAKARDALEAAGDRVAQAERAQASRRSDSLVRGGRVDPGGGAGRAAQRPVDGPRRRHGGRRRGRSREAAQRLETAQNRAEDRRDAVEALEADLTEELAAIDAKAAEDAAAIEAVDVPLEKTDVRVTALSVVWVPVA